MISEQIEYFLEESNSKTDYPKYLYDAAAADELPGQISSILHLKAARKERNKIKGLSIVF